MPILVVPPDSQWREQFAQEAARLSRALGGLRHELHHIGSTSIKGIYAKPVIDMLLLVDDLQALDANGDVLTRSGYEALGEFGIPHRRYFRKTSPQGVRTHQLHSFVRGSHGAIRHLAFRDYMNMHPAAASGYSDLKRRLAELHSHDPEAYIAGKDSFIQHHEAVAIAWASAPRNGT